MPARLEQKRDLASLFAAASVAALTGVNIEQDDNNFVAASEAADEMVL